jgi:thermostable 8-oxoguanine DNA glycosylase
MRQVTVTIPDEHYENLINFLKPIPDTIVDNREEEYNKKIQEMVLDRVKNSKPEDYVDARESLQRLKVKYGF